MKKVKIKNFYVGQNMPLALISGPCVIESEDHALKSAEILKKICSKLNIPFVYKSSYDKANRSSFRSFRGPGLEEGLKILEKVKHEWDVPVLTDVHTPEEAKAAAEVCDIIQIPAFLCRQTDLVYAAAQTKAVINVKKGQFMAPWDMKNVVDKILDAHNENIILTERGVTFGYNNYVSDMRSMPLLEKLGFPVCFDASHSVQLPGGAGHASGGQREFIPTLAKAAVASGAHLLFIESHNNPAEAKSDKDSVLPFDELLKLLTSCQKIHHILQDEKKL
ncbi:MAG: 3-deoxy-8-phosphooctulonate synthase [Rhabdochlamydiaceae bacterium]